MTNDKIKTGLVALASIYQKWSELCAQQRDNEMSPAIRWYMQGRADAHKLDAARAREAGKPTVTGSPPKTGDMFTSAYEAVLKMLRAASVTHEENG